MSDLQKFLFIPKDKDNTCKESFEFTIQKDGDTIYIRDLKIIGEMGCQGYIKIVSYLLKDKNIDSFEIEQFSKVTCNRNVSCGINLAEALRQIKDKYQSK